MKIVITGALGHIGSYLINHLSQEFKNLKLILIDNLSTNRYFTLFNISKFGNCKFIEKDINIDSVEEDIKDCDIVIHLAAITDAASSFKNKLEVEKNNFNGTKKVVNLCSKYKIKLIFFSSTSVYGTQKNIVDEDTGIDTLNPQSPYAEVKLKEEEIIKEYGNLKNLEYIILRCGTIYGFSTGMRFHTAVNKFTWQAVLGKDITVWRSAFDQKRPYLDLSDAFRAIVFILKNNLFDKKIYNILTDNLTVRDVIRVIGNFIPHLNIVEVDHEIVNQYSYEVSNNKFKSLGFEFKGSISKQIALTISNIDVSNKYINFTSKKQ